MFRRKQDASLLLQVRVRNCVDEAEYHMLRHQWDCINRPQYVRRTWSPLQEEALGAVAFFVAPGRGAGSEAPLPSGLWGVLWVRE